jgi:hypothetical protein
MKRPILAGSFAGSLMSHRYACPRPKRHEVHPDTNSQKSVPCYIYYIKITPYKTLEN